MANGFLVLNEKDWEKMSAEQREWAIFNTLQRMDDRLKVLERKSLIHKAYATLGGLIGGAAAYFGIKLAG